MPYSHSSSASKQLTLELFEVLEASTSGQPLDNNTLYDRMAANSGVCRDDLDATTPIGASGQSHSVAKRTIRWHQQTLKTMGLLERVEGKRGVWQLAQQNKVDSMKPWLACGWLPTLPIWAARSGQITNPF